MIFKKKDKETEREMEIINIKKTFFDYKSEQCYCFF